MRRSSSVGALARAELRMRPGPRIGEIRQLAARHGRRRRSRAPAAARARRAQAHAVLLAHDHEHDPRPQPALAVGSGRREQPRQIGVVELDRGQVVRFVVVRAGRRLGAHDLARIDAEHVRRARRAARCTGGASTLFTPSVTPSGACAGSGVVSGSGVRDACGEPLRTQGRKTTLALLIAGCSVWASSNSRTHHAPALEADALPSASAKVTSRLASGSGARSSLTAVKRAGLELGERRCRRVAARGAARCGPPRRAARASMQQHLGSGDNRASAAAAARPPCDRWCASRTRAATRRRCAKPNANCAAPMRSPACIGSNDGLASLSSSLISKNCAGAKSSLQRCSQSAARPSPMIATRGDAEAPRAGYRRIAEACRCRGSRFSGTTLCAHRQRAERMHAQRAVRAGGFAQRRRCAICPAGSSARPALRVAQAPRAAARRHPPRAAAAAPGRRPA